MKSDIMDLMKEVRNYLSKKEEFEKLVRDNIRPEAWKKEMVAESNKQLQQQLDKKLDQMQRFANERKTVAEIKLQKMAKGDDEAKQRFRNEVANELNGVSDPDMMMEYYEAVKSQEPELKQQETRKYIKNHLWKTGQNGKRQLA